jgi:hypothetical protein
MASSIPVSTSMIAFIIAIYYSHFFIHRWW